MLNLIRSDRLSIPWTLLRVWLGWLWLSAGLGKVSNPNWTESGTALQGYWAKALGVAPDSSASIKYGWFHSFIQALYDGGHHVWFAKLVVYGEILVGIGLILGAATVISLAAGAFMNLNYMLAGSASTNPVLYTVAILLLVAGPVAYSYGVDRLLIHQYYRITGNKRALAGKSALTSE